MNRLKNLIKGVDETIKKLRVEGDFQDNFMKIVQLAKSPFVQGLMASFNVDPKILDSVFDGLLHDKQVSDIVETIANIFECFSVNRFIGVETEQEMEDMAIKLNAKKLFYAGIYFGNNGYDNNKEFSYKLRLEADNVPVTLENRNRFWFPGPNSNFELNMRYHRGFIQLQHMLDQAIIKTVVDETNAERQEVWWRTTTTENPESGEKTDSSSSNSDSSGVEVILKVPTYDDDTEPPTDRTEVESGTESATDEISKPSKASEASTETETKPNGLTKGSDDAKDSSKPPVSSDVSDDEYSDSTESLKLVRKKRQDLSMISNVFGGWDDDDDEEEDFPGRIKFTNVQTFTKEFPYPMYRRDNFLTGLYLAQAIQLAFFFALIVQVSNAVRNRIWMRESGNSTVSEIFCLFV